MRDYYAPHRQWIRSGVKRLRQLKREMATTEVALQVAESYIVPFLVWDAAGDKHLARIMARHPRCNRCEVLVGPGHDESRVVRRCRMCRDDLHRIQGG